MPLIAEELLIKLMAAAAVGGAAAGGGVVINNYINNTPEKMEGRKVGLDCGRDGFCYLYGGEATVKQDNETRTLSSTPRNNGGKIKINKVSKEGEKDKFFFSIEEGEIALKAVDVGGGVSRSDKLEEFETYEIEEGSGNDKGKHFLVRKTKATDEIKKQLGLGDCTFPTDTTGVNCTIDEGKLKKIKFDGKKGDSTMTGDGNLTLTISGVSDIERGKAGSVKYPLGYKFEFSGQKQVTIPTGTNQAITKKANDAIEFKIKKEGRKLSLEKIWDVERIAGKLEFTDCKEEGEGENKTKTCKFPPIINVYKSESESVKEAKVTKHSEQTITFEEGATGFNGGVKFSLASPVAITGGTKTGTSFNNNTIEAGNYEIKQQTVGSEASAWYLSKKT